jgi:hypothetical protein
VERVDADDLLLFFLHILASQLVQASGLFRASLLEAAGEISRHFLNFIHLVNL